MAMMCLGYTGFTSFSFWIALYFQNIQGVSALGISLRLLPMFVNGVLANVVCGLILHRVSNKLLMGIAAISYTVAFSILALMREDSPNWAFIFPGQALTVIGADVEFNVTNVRE
jgi:predicted MFS family arabinose efflux permease